jgi:sulfite exporter TauE/SafE
MQRGPGFPAGQNKSYPQQIPVVYNYNRSSNYAQLEAGAGEIGSADTGRELKLAGTTLVAFLFLSLTFLVSTVGMVFSALAWKNTA